MACCGNKRADLIFGNPDIVLRPEQVVAPTLKSAPMAQPQKSEPTGFVQTQSFRERMEARRKARENG